MLEKIITAVSLWVIHVISTLGYGGIVLLMAIERLHPLPSEIIMPFSGYLVSTGQLNLVGRGRGRNQLRHRVDPAYYLVAAGR
jgi:hypothetical protein